MPSLSCHNLLDLAAADEVPLPSPTPLRLPRVMSVASPASPTSPSPPAPPRRVIVSHRLPLRAAPDPAAPFGFVFTVDSGTVAYQLRSGLPASAPVLHIGTLPAAAAEAASDELSNYLLANFSCLPVYLPSDLHHRFYHGFCKHYLWPLLHYLLPLTPSSLGGLPFQRTLYHSFLSANRAFADRLTEVLSPDEDLVWIHDYHLLALPTFLRKRFPRAKVGFFLHSPFPSSEIFRTIPVRDDLVRALLNADLVGFHTFDYARHFLSACSRLLGLDYQSKRGYIGIEYYGRTVTVKILPVGIDMGQLRSVVSAPETGDAVRRVAEAYKGRRLMIGVDDVDLFKGIGLKFLAMEQLLVDHPELRGRAVLVQITNPARSEGRDVQGVQDEARAISARVNARFGTPGYTPIVLLEGPVTPQEKAAYYAAAECCVMSAVRDGLNRIPYIYTVLRQESDALGDDAPKRSVIVLSEFVGCSPSLSGAIRVNPWSVESVAEAMNAALRMPEAEQRLRHEKHYKYVSTHDVAYWARSFDQDLQRACKDHFSRRHWGIGFGMSFKVVALGPNFRRLSVEHILPSYRRTENRLILLDYDGTVMPENSIDKAPSSEVISVLNRLCEDPKNRVFIVSGRGKDELSKWFAPCEKLGIAAEHGYFTRWSRGVPWETSSLAADFDWKKTAEPVMRLYTEATDGSSIEHKESALVWHHQEADPDFGSCQAKELLDHLENVLANEPVVVKRGQHIVEVNPQVSHARARNMPINQT
ncbi:probable alpha,alpha-trehalose-phosphate synthase [UDP-forming] 11 isoform X2 [Panicum virgatum]|uniref:probable alpha,alpha-trehalose-phosphate synthase [UDP-forming] 11 isoform X2 n=1 Tax=Panicum virgatum TaxID=38727 RepID=UPI0019D5130E|nr:probable alpha,alpha-trehalose-phosphate synthase [UDP-forming] 11 isoform X2 [Panicum virgatum]